MQSEAQFQRQVIQLAELCGWWVYHVPDSRRSAAGWPDLVLLHDWWRLLLFREIKTDRGQLRAEQILILAALGGAGADAGVWRPRDWPEIEATLTGRPVQSSPARALGQGGQ